MTIGYKLVNNRLTISVLAPDLQTSVQVRTLHPKDGPYPVSQQKPWLVDQAIH